MIGSSSGLHSGGYSLSADGQMLTIDAYADFHAGEIVTVTATTSVQAFDGGLLPSEYSFSFATIAGTPTPIEVGGTINEATVWTSGNVYLVTSPLTVAADAAQHRGGAVVKFQSQGALTVDGTLDLQGTQSSKVVFTSSQDDLYGGGAEQHAHREQLCDSPAQWDPLYNGNVFSGTAHPVIGVSGVLGQDTLWEDVQGLDWPYLVTEHVTVPAERGLTIAEGVVVKFNYQGATDWTVCLSVAGTLVSQGTEGNPIILTSSRDDAYGGTAMRTEAFRRRPRGTGGT